MVWATAKLDGNTYFLIWVDGRLDRKRSAGTQLPRRKPPRRTKLAELDSGQSLSGERRHGLPRSRGSLPSGRARGRHIRARGVRGSLDDQILLPDSQRLFKFDPFHGVCFHQAEKENGATALLEQAVAGSERISPRRRMGRTLGAPTDRHRGTRDAAHARPHL